MATDQSQFIDQMRDRYGDRVLSLNAMRSQGFTNTFQKSGGRNYQKGEEVLMDCLLLSRCDFLLKCTSAVGEFAMYFNPDLKCYDLNHLCAPGPLETKLRVAWRSAVRGLQGQPLLRRWRKLLLLIKGHTVR